LRFEIFDLRFNWTLVIISHMHLIDTHCHLSHFPKKDFQSVIKRAERANVKKMITVACKLEEIGECIAMADENENIWATAGIHPTELNENIEKNLERVFEYAKHEKKVVAIGEIGLDYYHDRAPHDLQAAYFIGQLNISKQLDKPAIIHCRGGKNPGENEQAFIDMMRILEQMRFTNGVVHCFSGNRVEAEKLLDLGLMLSFTGIVTYPRNEELLEVIAETPLDRIMLETDSPYIAVEGKRKGPGEPAYTFDIAKKIAEIKDVPIDEVIRITTENAEKFFGI
jgi:TatD DNase family protein